MIPDFDPPIDSDLWELAHNPEMGQELYLTSEILAEAAEYLCSYSNYFIGFKPMDYVRYIYTPILLDQALFMFAPNPKTGLNQPRGFLTWAWLSKKAEEEYIQGSRGLHAADYVKTSSKDVLWIINFTTPFDNRDAFWLCRQAQNYLSPICKANNLKGAKIKRVKKGEEDRIGYFYAK